MKAIVKVDKVWLALLSAIFIISGCTSVNSIDNNRNEANQSKSVPKEVKREFDLSCWAPDGKIGLLLSTDRRRLAFIVSKPSGSRSLTMLSGGEFGITSGLAYSNTGRIAVFDHMKFSYMVSNEYHFVATDVNAIDSYDVQIEVCDEGVKSMGVNPLR
ncbi:MAG TPA: hypothetical protein VFV96_13195 [Verrucomicrobiae bacterium]|nr:hypothetical protein [Verrucomicrobiae bacterium]